MDRQMIGMCGAYCGACEWKDRTRCPGCQASAGKVFWGTCSVARCSIDKGLEHCGLCPEVPCEQLASYFSDPEHGDHGERLANLKAWANGEQTYMSLRTLREDGAPEEREK